MSAPVHAVVCDGLTFAWPDGTPVLTGLDCVFDSGRTALIGRNGSGKSTLLRLIAGELTPAAGRLARAGSVGYLAQQLPLHTTRTVADLLGVGDRVRAVRAVTSGDVDPELFATIGDDWDVEERARAVLDRLGVPADLDRTVGTVSGGEAVLTALAGLLVRRPAITLLDEPTNDLDRPARETLYEAVRTWPGVLIVVSHDRELLECVDAVVELRADGVRTFGGTFAEYEAALAVEQDAAERMVRAAEGDVRRERRQQIETQSKLAQRRHMADKAYLEKRRPRIVMRTRKRQAQVSAAKYREVQDGRVDQARAALDSAQARVRSDPTIRIALPSTAVPEGRTVLRFDDVVVRGPERIAVLGRNGAGKTTLLRKVMPLAQVPVGYLPQRLDVLDPQLTLLENVRAAAPVRTPQEVRAELARFLLRGRQVDRHVASLSGGERFRATLATVLLADPAPQLLVLDEPTNNLDLDSVAQLVAALQAYRGALLVVSHDEHVLEQLDVTRAWTLEHGRLTTDRAC